MRLHNFAIDEDGVTGFRQFSIRDDDDLATQAFEEWWRTATSLRDSFRESQGARRDLEYSSLRDELTTSLQSRGITRPALS